MCQIHYIYQLKALYDKVLTFYFNNARQTNGRSNKRCSALHNMTKLVFCSIIHKTCIECIETSCTELGLYEARVLKANTQKHGPVERRSKWQIFTKHDWYLNKDQLHVGLNYNG